MFTPGTVGARRALVVVTGSHVRVHDLPAEGEVTVGRGSECAVCVDHPTLARTHLALRLGSTVAVIDRGSVGGTRLRGERLPPEQPVEILAHETVHAGDVSLYVREVPVARGSAPLIDPLAVPAAVPDALLLIDPAMRQLYETAARVARGTIAVLVVGETGAGKEVLAEYLHRCSPRQGAPLVRINCAALTESLVESELFGHDRGAFTGAAQQRVGLIEAADGGTVLLDEVGELSPAVQAKLLRVLEDRRVTRVGSTAARVVDVRFVAATNRDLAGEVAAGRFRRDLYFRLANVVLTVPPLRARPLEIEPLARGFLADAAARLHLAPPTLPPAALAALHAHPWPGNVRELKATMERAALVADGVVEVADLGLVTEPPPVTGSSAPPRAADALHAELATLERRRILDALEKCGGNQTRAAALLGVPRRTLVKRIAKHGIRRPRDP